MNKFFAIATLPVVIAVGGCHEPTATTGPEQPVAVHTVTISVANGNGTVSIAGVVKPRLEADLTSQIVAPVTAVTKREGDRFRRGEVLVRLHAPALDAGVAQANAALSSAENQEASATTQAKLAADNLGRYAQLRERHSVTPYELDQMRAQSASAQAQQQGAAAQVVAARSMVAAQRANASDAVLYAPFDGVVTRRLADPGAMAAPGVPLLHVQSAGDLEVHFSVPEGLMRSLGVGTAVSVTLDGRSVTQAKVANISPAGDSASHSFLVRAALPETGAWRAGTVVQVLLPVTPAAARIFVPAPAVVQQGGLDAVLIATRDGRAEVRYVTLRASTADQAEILSGLQPGDRVLERGDLALAGRKIVVQP